MKQALHTVLKTLGDPLPGTEEIAALDAMEARWRHFEERERQVMPRCAEAEHQAAYAAFVENPNTANERRLMVLADADLTAKRHAVLRRAFAEIRGRLTAQAGEILRPFAERISAALEDELSRRLAKADPLKRNSDPAVKECRRAIDAATHLGSHVLWAGGGTSDESPLMLAELLLLDGENVARELTPEANS
jgi:hypothetical protein